METGSFNDALSVRKNLHSLGKFLCSDLEVPFCFQRAPLLPELLQSTEQLQDEISKTPVTFSKEVYTMFPADLVDTIPYSCVLAALMNLYVSNDPSYSIYVSNQESNWYRKDCLESSVSTLLCELGAFNYFGTSVRDWLQSVQGRSFYSDILSKLKTSKTELLIGMHLSAVVYIESVVQEERSERRKDFFADLDNPEDRPVWKVVAPIFQIHVCEPAVERWLFPLVDRRGILNSIDKATERYWPMRLRDNTEHHEARVLASPLLV